MNQTFARMLGLSFMVRSVEPNAGNERLPAELGQRRLTGRFGGFVAWAALCAGFGVAATSCTTEVVNHVAAPDEAHGLVASGSGKVTAAPDTAVVNIGVETRGADPKAAVEQNNQ